MSGNRLQIKWIFVLMVPVVLLSLSACDDTFQPFEEEALYSIHGALDMDKETNHIRVRNMRAPFTAEGTRELDAIVTLQNLDSDEAAVLESEIIEFEGIYYHNYIVEGIIEPNTNYLITAEQSGGGSLSLPMLSPTRAGVNIEPLNEKCNIPVTISIGPLNGGTVVLQFGIGLSESDPWTHSFVFAPDFYENSNSINLTFNNPLILAQLATVSSGNCASLLRNDILYMRVTHYAPGFYELIADELDEPDDILETSQRFGAFYEEIVPIPVDTSPN